MDATLLSGRLDQARCADLMKEFCSGTAVDAAYLCGPESMILGCEALLAFGLAEDQIKFELFTSAGAANPPPRAPRAVETASHANCVGRRHRQRVSRREKNMLDAALDAGLDACNCLGGVCCTCRAKLVKGKADERELRVGTFGGGAWLRLDLPGASTVTRTWCWTLTSNKLRFGHEKRAASRQPFFMRV